MESDPRSGSPRLLVLGAGPAQLGLLEAAQARGVWTRGRRPRPGRAGFRPRRPALHPLDRGRARDRAARRRARDRRDHLARHRLAGRRRRTDRASARGCRTRSRRETAVLATNKLRQRERLREAGVPQPRSWVVGGGDERARGLGAGRRQGARPAGPEGADARRPTRPSCPRRSRPRAARRGTAWRSSRSSSTGPR